VLDERGDGYRCEGVRRASVRSMSSGPRRHSSHEIPTIVLPREQLAPVRVAVDRDAETLVPCPCCAGTGLVTSGQRAAWRTTQTYLLESPKAAAEEP
jgi:hypothetical protein